MENITNQVLDLENGKKYFVLRQAVYKGVTYFLGAELTPDEEDFTNNFVFLERVGNDDLMIKKVTDQAVIDVLAKNIKIE
jgi:hypothetical protein